MGQRILYIFTHLDLDCIRLHTYFENLVLKIVATKRLTFFLRWKVGRMETLL